eukprot:36891-Eustigmatos_ZCMA.PRE.1
MARFQFTTGGLWINLRDEPFFKKTQSIINVKNLDNHNCFQYAVVVGKHYDEMGNDEGQLQVPRKVNGIFKKWLPRYPKLN